MGKVLFWYRLGTLVFVGPYPNWIDLCPPTQNVGLVVVHDNELNSYPPQFTVSLVMYFD
jgi:hypothetical protein